MTDRTESKKNKKVGKLYGQFLKMTLLPLLGFAFVIMLFVGFYYTRSIKEQTKTGLEGVAVSVLHAYDTMYAGEFATELDENGTIVGFHKGDVDLSGEFAYIDSVKRETGVDITVFYDKIRMLTTIEEKEKRAVGSYASDEIVRRVLAGGKTAFFDNVVIGKIHYFAYYMPIRDAAGETVGMIAVARESGDVNGKVYGSLGWILCIMVAAAIITAVLLTFFSKKIVHVITRMMDFLREMSKGNLDVELDYVVANRDDELGEMGRFTTKVQGSLRKLVERDGLTGLLNRRTGDKKIAQKFANAQKRGEHYSVAIGDIDFFKKVNDTYGHEAGDVVLKNVARTLSEGMSGKGFVARWGGEEFLIVFEEYTVEQSHEILEGILNTIRGLVIESGEDRIRVTMSFGITEGGVSENVLAEIAEADRRLYYAKEHGRNQIITVIPDEVPAEDATEVSETEEPSEESEASEAAEMPETVQAPQTETALERLAKRAGEVGTTLTIVLLLAVSGLLTGCGKKAGTAHVKQAISYVKDTEYDSALTELKAAEEAHEDTIQVKRAYGLAYMGQGKYALAVEAFLEALGASDGNISELEYDINYYLAVSYSKLGNYEDAITCYDAIIGLRPKNKECYYLRGIARLENGDFDGAIEDFNKTISLEKTDYSAYIDIYSCLAAKGYEEKGDEYLSEVMERENSAMSSYDKGRICYYLGDYENACTYLEQAYKKHDTPEVMMFLGRAYMEAGNLNYVISLYSKYLQSNTKSATVYNELGICKLKQGDASGALEAFQTALTLEDTSLRQTLRYNEIVAYEYLGEFEQAKSLLATYLESYPDDEAAKREAKFLGTR